MIAKPPRFGSKRFREILLPAFKGDAAMALRGVYFTATRRRLRGWSRLLEAASKGPLNYLHWIGHGEVRAFSEFRQTHLLATDEPSIVVLLINEAASAAAVEVTLDSVGAAIGDPLVYGPASTRAEIQQLPGGGLRTALETLARRHPRAWLLPLLAGDQVSPALADILARSMAVGEESLLYWDEDRVAAGRREDPWVKPQWDPLLFGAIDGLLGASIFSLDAALPSLDLLDDAAVEPNSLRGLMFRIAQGKRSRHIPLILTHRWTGRALNLTSPKPPLPSTWPSVSIIVPTRDKPELLAACLEGIARTDYPGRIQTIIVDNGSRDAAALELIGRAERDPNTRIVRDEGEFNFSRLNNAAAVYADGQLLCLHNNDVVPVSSAWLTELVRYAAQDDVGAVGPQLVYPSGRIQHAGVAVGLGGAAGHVQKGVDPEQHDFRTWHAVTREVAAVTAAVLVIKKSIFHEVGGLEEEFPVAFNDVDFCLRVKERGLRNIYVADVRMVHRESESRGRDRAPAQAQRFARELALLQARWDTQNYLDPHFSPLFSRLVERCVLAP